MTKCETLIKGLVEKNTKMLNRLSDETLFILAGAAFLCDECPLNGNCSLYMCSTCEESIKAWFYEGG